MFVKTCPLVENPILKDQSLRECRRVMRVDIDYGVSVERCSVSRERTVESVDRSCLSMQRGCAGAKMDVISLGFVNEIKGRTPEYNEH
jgi:hypothetical protein